MLHDVSSTETAATGLVLVLHGYGSDATSMDWLVARLTAGLDRIKVVAIEAPQQVPGGGRRWFDIGGVPETGRGPRARAAIPLVENLVSEQLLKNKLGHSNLALLGFSQGATTALQYAVSAAEAPRAVIAFSGRLPNEIDAEVKKRAAILLGHGDADPIIPVSEMNDAAARMRFAGFDVTSNVESGLGHTISDGQVEAAIGFLRKVFSNHLPNQKGT